MADLVKNAPELWTKDLPRPALDGHKYDRGHTVILGSDAYTGATRLAAEACSRIGSGLVSVVSATQAQTYRQTLPPDIMVADAAPKTLTRVNTLLAGPGGCSEAQADAVLALQSDVKLVLDADAIRLWPDVNDRDVIMTPHEGEFSRYFGEPAGDEVARAADAAKRSSAVIVLKRPNTIIAAPDGRIVENHMASPYLAKAGSGDVLAGLIAGLVAQGMPCFAAACAGVWIHGKASERIGPGLVPQDMFPELRSILAELLL
ncbi:MAG: NAD(P)H-hydrate dehydratase [Henriciella sp.]|nr:NAD(P)H-hydrate dehydratase [Henriciella sp.]